MVKAINRKRRKGTEYDKAIKTLLWTGRTAGHQMETM